MEKRDRGEAVNWRETLNSTAMVAAAMVLLGAPVVRAETQVFSCVAGQRSNSTYQPQSMQVTVDFDRLLVRVEDELTRKVQDGPLIGEVDTWNDSRLTVSWVIRELPSDLKDVSSNFGNATVFQRLTIRPRGESTLTSDVTWNLPRKKPQYRMTVTCDRKK